MKLHYSEKLYNVVAAIIFIAGVAIFSYMAIAYWMPALFLITGLSLIVRQVMQGRHLDVMILFVVFGGAFCASFFSFISRIFLPVFLIIGAVYFLIRQFFDFGGNKDQDLPKGKAPKIDDTD